MAGHSKWKQIKHKKAATDAKRGALFGKMARAITAAVRAASSEDAPSVQAIIERARSIDMPKENIERAVEKGMGQEGDLMETLVFELFGPGGVACIVSAVTDSRNRTVQEIKHLVSEYGCAIGTSGSSSWAFKKNEDGTYEALNPQVVNDEDSHQLHLLLDALYEHGDVDAVFTNYREGV